MAVGVKVTSSARGGSAGDGPDSGQYFLAGLTERGPVDRPVTCRNMGDVERQLGSRVTFGSVWDDLNAFFAEGGALAHVARVVAATGTSVGQLTLVDTAAVPVNTLRLDAANPGAWSSRLTAEVIVATADNGLDPGTYRLIIRLDGVIVEDYSNLATPAAAAAAFSGSDYVRVIDLGAGTNPAALAPTALSAGNDNRAAVVAGDYVTALARFPLGLGDGAVAIPGQSSGTVQQGLLDHARNNRRIALLAAPRGTGESGLRAMAQANPSQHAGVFAPWVQVPNGAGGVRAISPEGFVAGKRAGAHRVGPWRAPAGLAGASSGGGVVLGLDQSFTAAEIDRLEEGRVNAIRLVNGLPRLYGWRSTSRDEANYALLTAQDTINRFITEGERLLEPFVFETIDGRGQLLSRVNAEMVGMLEPARAAGGLFALRGPDGDFIDPGYLVDTGEALNNAQSLSQNRLRVNVAIRVSPVGALIQYSIVKVGLTAAL